MGILGRTRSRIKNFFSKKDDLSYYEKYLNELSNYEYLDELFNIPELLNKPSEYSIDKLYKTLNNSPKDKEYLIKLDFLFQNMDGYSRYKTFFNNLIRSLRNIYFNDLSEEDNEIFFSVLMSDKYPDSDRLKQIETDFENNLKDYYENKLKDYYKKRSLQGYGKKIFSKSLHSGGKYIKKTKKSKKSKSKKSKSKKVKKVKKNKTY